MFNILFLYHDPCTDGFLCRIIAQTYYEKPLNFERNVTYVGVNPSVLTADLDKVLNGKKFDIILMFDVSCAPENYKQLLAAAPDVRVFDHHEATLKNFPNIASRSWLTFDNSKCGAHLAFDYFYGCEINLPKIVQYVQVRDLWLFGTSRDLPHSKEITTYLYSKPFRLPFQDANEYRFLLFQDTQEYWDNAKKEGAAMLKEIDAKVNAIVQTMCKRYVMYLDTELSFLVTQTSDFVSEVGDCATQLNPTVDFILLWSFDSEKRVRLSLRSDAKKCNVNDVAKKLWKGGGHAAAAGALLTNENDQNNFFEMLDIEK